MCTVSWLRHEHGYVLASNRDERYTRKPAEGPISASRRGVSYVAPIDGDHGGSWIGVNAFGLTLCLLNRYQEQTSASEQMFTSRGLFLTSLIDCRSTNELIKRVSSAALNAFRPFTMLAVGIDGGTAVFEWNGINCLVQPEADTRSPLISSSFREPQVFEYRRREFEELVAENGRLDATVLDRFHRSHRPERGPYSVCMHRADAATMSLSVVTVGPDGVEFRYQAGSPCNEGEVKIVELPLTR